MLSGGGGIGNARAPRTPWAAPTHISAAPRCRGCSSARQHQGLRWGAVREVSQVSVSASPEATHRRRAQMAQPDVWMTACTASRREPRSHAIPHRAACGQQKTLDLTRFAERLSLATRIVAVSFEEMADDEEMDVEKDSKEGPRFVVKKWCGAPKGLAALAPCDGSSPA